MPKQCQVVSKIAVYLAGFILLSSLFLACRKSVGPVSPLPLTTTADGIIPLEVGYQWTYRISFFDSSGALLSTGESTTRIVRDTVIVGERWFIDDGGTISTNRHDGNWTMRARVPYLTFTSTLGDSAFIMGYVWIKLVSTSDRVAVPAGEFASYRYHEVHWKVSDQYAVYNIVPHEGIVRTAVCSMTLSGRPYLAYTTELLSTNVPLSSSIQKSRSL